MPWQLVVDQRPLAVLAVADADDVATAVRWAATHDIAVTAQPVGHAATVALNGTLLLRTRGLSEISVDAAARTAWVGAGVKWGELLAALHGTRLGGCAGSSTDPTVVGFTLTGGLSWFSRLWGLSCDNVLAVDLVDPRGQKVRVTRDSDPDLFWALRGGGGDFGIVTAMQIVLHPAPQLYGGRLLWPIGQAAPVLRAFRQVAVSAPRRFSIWAHLYQFPPFPEVPEPLRGKAFASVAVAYLGPAEEAEQLLAPVRAVAEPTMDLMGEVPLAELGSIADEPVDPIPAIEHSMLLNHLDDDAIDALVEAAGEGSGSAVAIVQIRPLGGAIATPHPDKGAAGHIEQPFQLFCVGIPAAPGLAEAIVASLQRIDGSLRGAGSVLRLPNFLGREQERFSCWTPTALVRLREIKQQRDPQGTIRSNRPVLPQG